MLSLGQVITADKYPGLHRPSTQSPMHSLGMSTVPSVLAALADSICCRLHTPHPSPSMACLPTHSSSWVNMNSATPCQAILITRESHPPARPVEASPPSASPRSASLMPSSDGAIINRRPPFVPNSSGVRTPPDQLATLSAQLDPPLARISYANTLHSSRAPSKALSIHSSSSPPTGSPPPLHIIFSIGATLPPSSDYLPTLAPVNLSNTIHTTSLPPSCSIPSLSPRTTEQTNTSAVATVTLATIQQPSLGATAVLPSPSTAILPPSPADNKPLSLLTSTKALARHCQSRSNSTSRSKSHCSLRDPNDPPSLSMEFRDIIITATTTTSSPCSRSLSLLSPTQDHLAQHLAETSIPVCSDFNIAAIGSITIVDDTIESPEPQLAPKDSDEALQWDKECQVQ
ncbi:hypothetical protein PCASD_22610 [Puccinia coronata f. sp. avenae]|uniref:Uncharacterized protein n=1 Tax=Puccinia coronata f. sp. avenae TaxID=200324 RepID=A0A2N5TRG2_9BASI|nr:hypothetical protein PCASD_22610 [Puccinia coronata f. sp. avenae]